MELKVLYCPSCGANIDFDMSGRDFFFCPYCGAKILVDNGKIHIQQDINYTEHIINEADVIRAKNEAENVTQVVSGIKDVNREMTKRTAIKERSKVEVAKVQSETQQKELENPTTNIVLIICVCLMFVAFMALLAYIIPRT